MAAKVNHVCSAEVRMWKILLFSLSTAHESSNVLVLLFKQNTVKISAYHMHGRFPALLSSLQHPVSSSSSAYLVLDFN